MQMTKRLICTVIVFALMVCCLASCDLLGETDPLELIDEADQYLEENAYAVTLSITYSSDDEAIKDVIKELGKITMSIKIDGENFEYVVTNKGDSTTYVLLDGTLYATNSYGDSLSFEYTDEIKEGLTEAYDPGVMLTADDFETHEASEPNGKNKIVCTDLTDEALDKIIDDLTAQFEIFYSDITVAIKDAKLSIQLSDGQHDVSMFECLYFITIGEKSYSLNMTYHAKYSYDDVVITAPAID